MERFKRIQAAIIRFFLFTLVYVESEHVAVFGSHTRIIVKIRFALKCNHPLGSCVIHLDDQIKINLDALFSGEQQFGWYIVSVKKPFHQFVQL